MANMDGFDDAVNMVHKYNLNNKVGIHINISEGQPLTEKIKKMKYFCDFDGRFITRKYNLKEIFKFHNSEETSALRAEVNAQIMKCRENGLTLTHIDSHHHKHIEFYMLVLLGEILKQNKINHVRLASVIGNKCTDPKSLYRNLYNIYIKNILGASKVDEFIYFKDFNKLNLKKDKNIEIMCHPIYRGNEIYDGEEKLKDLVYDLQKQIDFNMISYSEFN